jgi:prepilin-type processing-associated H-X9-DG protein
VNTTLSMWYALEASGYTRNDSISPFGNCKSFCIHPTPLAAVPTPSETCIFVDCQKTPLIQSNWNAWTLGVPGDPCCWGDKTKNETWWRTSGWPHNGGSNFAFLDGHAKWRQAKSAFIDTKLWMPTGTHGPW